MKANYRNAAGERPEDSAPAERAVHFGRHRILPALRVLLCNGKQVRLGAKAFDVLSLLLEARGALVAKDDLIEKVWAGAVVEENNLQAQICAIRRALGRDRDMIATEFGRGYRLVVSNNNNNGDPAQPADRRDAAAACLLPQPVTALLGRDSELSDIARLIEESRCVTLTGAGGIGKTRLAIEIGLQARARFGERIYLAEMAKVAEADLVWPTIAAALRPPSSDARVVEQIQACLRRQRLLLIIDNCEHLAGPIAAAVEILLRTGRGVHVLVTAQEPLGAEGEHVYRLAPLAVPPAETETAASALSHAAVQLFVDRAYANAHDFQFSDAKARCVSAICRRLDGMPLALELAAARVPALGLQGVLAGLGDRFKLLTVGRRTALPRHRTLRAAIDWSYSLLDEDERRLFSRLAVFPSHFSAVAARRVAAPEFDEPWRIVDLLAALVTKSLLLSDVTGAAPHYRFLENIRCYALEKLAESGEDAATTQRHAAFFAEIARQASSDWASHSTFSGVMRGR
jgi:predicted ATPase/DNA-binding winged helix-turn-helix (wHTH) protein